MSILCQFNGVAPSRVPITLSVINLQIQDRIYAVPFSQMLLLTQLNTMFRESNSSPQGCASTGFEIIALKNHSLMYDHILQYSKLD